MLITGRRSRSAISVKPYFAWTSISIYVQMLNIQYIRKNKIDISYRVTRTDNTIYLHHGNMTIHQSYILLLLFFVTFDPIYLCYVLFISF